MAAGKTINLAMRGLQFLWALLVMALVGDIIANANAGNPSIINYDMFCAVFAMLSLFYLIPATIKEDLNKLMIPLALDILNTIFWFCGAVATAAKLNVHSCDNSKYLRSNSITNGSDNRSKRCTEAQASTAFLFFGFAAFAVSAVLSGLGGGGANLRPSRVGRGPTPAMSQA